MPKNNENFEQKRIGLNYIYFSKKNYHNSNLFGLGKNQKTNNTRKKRVGTHTQNKKKRFKKLIIERN